METNQNLEYKNAVLANKEQKTMFLKGIFYGDYNPEDFKKLGVSLEGCKSLYDQLKGCKITEYLGVYYQNDNPDVPDVNKTQKRVITYKVEK